MHRNLTCVYLLYVHAIIDTKYMHAMIDTWLYIWFYYRLFSLLFIYVLDCYCIHSILTIIILYILLFPHFTHSLRVFYLFWICISRSRIISFCWSGIWRGSHVLWGAQSFPLRDYPIWILFISSLFILIDFFESL